MVLQGEAFRTAFRAMVEAHARMYDAVKESDAEDADGDGLSSQVSIVYAVAPVKPMDPDSELDRQATLVTAEQTNQRIQLVYQLIGQAIGKVFLILFR